MAKRIVKGFLERSKELGDPFHITQKIELEKSSLKKEALLAENKNDALIILRSSGARFLGKGIIKKPAFIGAANHPFFLDVIKDIKAPESNITGVTYAVPLNIPYEVFQTLIPKMKHVAFLYEKDHPGAQIDLHYTKIECKERNLQCIHIPISSEKEIFDAIQKHQAKTDVFALANNAILTDITHKIVEKASDKPVLSYGKAPVKLGAIAGFAPDDHVLGKKLADSVHKVIIENIPIKKVPVVFGKPDFYVNKQQLKKHNIELSAELRREFNQIDTVLPSH